MRTKIIAVAIALNGCAQTPQKAMTYWSEKNGTVTVHHVTGKIDQTEKLTQKEFKSDQLDVGKYFSVTQANAPFNMPTHPKTETDKLSAKIDDLQRELENVKAAYHKESKHSDKVPTDLKNATAEPEPTPAQETTQYDPGPRQSQ